jgi:hypothetical protein
VQFTQTSWLVYSKCMNGRRVGVMVLSLVIILVAFLYGCVVAGFLTAIWSLRVAPHDGQSGLAVMMVGLIGGVACAGATLFFVVWVHQAARKGHTASTVR